MNAFSTLPLAGILGLGSTEIVLVLAVMLLLFGGAKLPALARGFGQSIREFKKASNEAEPTPAAVPEPAVEAKIETRS